MDSGMIYRTDPIQRVVREARGEAQDLAMSPLATRAFGAGNRDRREEPDPYRTCFERDRDRAAGDKASVDTPICEVDLEVIKEAGLSPITPDLISNKASISDLTILPGEPKVGETETATFALAPVNA